MLAGQGQPARPGDLRDAETLRQRHAPPVTPLCQGIRGDADLTGDGFDGGLHGLTILTTCKPRKPYVRAHDCARLQAYNRPMADLTSSQIQQGFGRRLAYLREQRGYATQVALAAVVGVNPTAVNHWESGRNLPRPPDLLRLCQLLRVTSDWLFWGRVEGLAQETFQLISSYRDAPPNV